MDVGPAHQPRSPVAFLSGGRATFPTLGTVPHIRVYGNTTQGEAKVGL